MERKNRCCIATCKGERFDLAHKFPRSQEAAETWLQVIGDTNLRRLNLKKLSESHQVCARHFLVSDYKHPQSRSLNKLAVPSLNLKNLNQLHLARDASPREEENQRPNLSNPYPIQCTSDSNSHEPENTSIEPELLSVICNKELPNIDAANQEDGNGIRENIEFIEMSSDEMDDILNSRSDVTKDKISFKVSDITTVLKITHPKHKQPLHLNAVWLRCHCDCSECFDPQTKRKKCNPIDLPKYIQPRNIRQDEDTDTLIVEWNDGHFSIHDINFIFKAPKERQYREKKPFDSNTFKNHPQINFSNLCSFDDQIKTVFVNLLLHGFICVTGISTQNSAMAKLVINRLFPHMEFISFEPFNEIHSDICTNLTCTNFYCGLKCFFATKKSEIILVDGLNVAEKLKESDGHAYEMLTSTTVALSMRDSYVYHQKFGSIINIDNEMQQNSKIQLDMHSVDTLKMMPTTTFVSFYHSLHQFVTIIRCNKNQIHLTLDPGTMIILDNWRVLHKISNNDGVLQSYLERNDYIGRAKFLELL